MAKDVRVLGFNYTQISVERNPDFEGEVKVKSNINISNIEKFKAKIAKQDALKVSFESNIDYGELGKVVLKGNMIITADSKSLKETLSAWKEKRPNELQITIMNIIIQKTSIKSIQLEEEIGLPVHLQNIFPKIKTKQEK